MPVRLFYYTSYLLYLNVTASDTSQTVSHELYISKIREFKNDIIGQKNLRSFMKNCRLDFGKPQINSSIVEQHERMRDMLYNQYGSDSSSRTLEELNRTIEETGDFSSSWQRRLPHTAKQALKTALIRRVIATLPVYDSAKHNFEAKAHLYDKRYISDDHWINVRSDYEKICADLKQLIFEGNCVDDNWAVCPGGMVSTAAAVLHHEKMKRQEKETEKQNIKNEEKERQKLEKAQKIAQRNEEEEQVRQARAADEAMKKLLSQDIKPKIKKKK